MMAEETHVVRPRGRADPDEEEDELGDQEYSLDDIPADNSNHINNKEAGIFALEEKSKKKTKDKKKGTPNKDKEEKKRLEEERKREEKERKRAEQERKKEEQQRKKEEQQRKKQEAKSPRQDNSMNHSVTDDDLSMKENVQANGNDIDRDLQKRESKRLKEEEKQRRKEELRKQKESKKELEQQKKANTKSPVPPAVQGSNFVRSRVLLLDGTNLDLEIEKRAYGLFLFEKVCDHINLLEKDYFGLYYYDYQNVKTWLEPEAKLHKQIRLMKGGLNFIFGVKFYPPYPTQLREDMARYQICLQVRNDIATEALPCTFLTQALLGSYTAQSELGDYDVEEHGAGYSYLEVLRFAPEQSTALLEKIAELHKTHRGLTPEQAEYHFLENARKLEFYGVEFFNSRDSEQPNVLIRLGVSARGLLIYKDRRQLNRFAWPQILKMSYSSRIFYITLRPVEFQPYQNVIGFNMENSHIAKHIWWICSAHHTFFRLKDPDILPRSNSLISFGSKFRYSGRTQHQASHRNVPRSASMLSLGSKSNFSQSGRLHSQSQRIM
ncbi:band 4.1-like protein 2 [Liolophura sinensis]|uniref:band 4.1-like protein 2 n=1 Tax=Liolophura sinensis TaxID=3198878 RepID=UPI003157FF29